MGRGVNMEKNRCVSTGIQGFDSVIDQLRLGDNVVWQVESLDEYRRVVRPYVRQAKADGRTLVYIRFGSHEPVILQEDTARSLSGNDPPEIPENAGILWSVSHYRTFQFIAGR